MQVSRKKQIRIICLLPYQRQIFLASGCILFLYILIDTHTHIVVKCYSLRNFYLPIFYWSIIALQRYVSFCSTTKWIGYMCIHLSPLSWAFFPSPHPSPLGCCLPINSFLKLWLSAVGKQCNVIIWRTCRVELIVPLLLDIYCFEVLLWLWTLSHQFFFQQNLCE